MDGPTIPGELVTMRAKRDRLYISLFESRDPWKVYHLLKENGIKYVAYDNAIRQAQFIKRPNQELYATYFPKVYEADKYNGLVIYKVPIHHLPISARCLKLSVTCLKEARAPARVNLIFRLELLLIAMGIFSLPIRTMVVSRSSRLRVRFSIS